MATEGRARRTWMWTAISLVWLAFTFWYTSCGGPLTAEEIDHYIGVLEAQEAPPEQVARMRDFMESDTGDDFVMVNVIEMNADPGDVPGMPQGASAEEIVSGYMAYMWPALLSRACHPVFFGQATAPSMEQIGIEGVERWDRAAGMRYRSRRDLLEIAMNEEFEDAHLYKVAAMSKTFAFPVDPWGQLGDPRLFLFLVLALVGLLLERLRVV